MNYLEQIVGEWYEYSGYFVRRNILVGKRSKGGYEGELDITIMGRQQMIIIIILGGQASVACFSEHTPSFCSETVQSDD